MKAAVKKRSNVHYLPQNRNEVKQQKETEKHVCGGVCRLVHGYDEFG